VRVYFKNLDGIRFIAALMVILEHTSDYIAYQEKGFPNVLRKYVIEFGSYGVTLFFVLSGYLIFYLLFSEKKWTGDISIRNFYIRRVLRIWPLYLGFGLLLILGIDFFFSKVLTSIHTPVGQNLFYLLTFSINLQLLFAPLNKGIIDLYWSVCIEEQFYLVAPWLVKKAYNHLPAVIGSLIGIGLASKFVLHYLETVRHFHFNGFNPLYFFTLCRFDNFGLGALAAWIYFKQPLYAKVRRVVENKWVQAGVCLLTFLFITHIIPQPGWINTYFFSTAPAILFAFLILAASTGHFLFNLEKPLFRYLGKYSYGIYVFHAVVSELILLVFLKHVPSHSIFYYDVLYPLVCIGMSCAVAGLSYELYERHFLKLKQRFTVIKNHEV
jgi:peptidoglycan/LPS O-acetylase OafA/YrhL